MGAILFDRLIGAETENDIVRLAILLDVPPGAGLVLVAGFHVGCDVTVFQRQ